MKWRITYGPIVIINDTRLAGAGRLSITQDEITLSGEWRLLPLRTFQTLLMVSMILCNLGQLWNIGVFTPHMKNHLNLLPAIVLVLLSVGGVLVTIVSSAIRPRRTLRFRREELDGVRRDGTQIAFRTLSAPRSKCPGCVFTLPDETQAQQVEAALVSGTASPLETDITYGQRTTPDQTARRGKIVFSDSEIYFRWRLPRDAMRRFSSTDGLLVIASLLVFAVVIGIIIAIDPVTSGNIWQHANSYISALLLTAVLIPLQVCAEYNRTLAMTRRHHITEIRREGLDFTLRAVLDENSSESLQEVVFHALHADDADVIAAELGKPRTDKEIKIPIVYGVALEQDLLPLKNTITLRVGRALTLMGKHRFEANSGMPFYISSGLFGFALVMCLFAVYAAQSMTSRITWVLMLVGVTACYLFFANLPRIVRVPFDHILEVLHDGRLLTIRWRTPRGITRRVICHTRTTAEADAIVQALSPLPKKA